MEVIPPAQAVSDDVLVFVFKQLSAGWGPHTAQKIASTRFVWFRNTLPLVCKRWKRLVLGTPALWSSLVVDPTAEAHHVKRSGRHENAGSYDEQPKGGSGSCTPVRGASPLFGTSPDSDSGGYWTSQYAPYQVPAAQPGGGSPPTWVRQELNRLSLGRQHHRCSLSAHAVISWVQQHPAAASGASRLLLDLGHHPHHDFDRQQLELLLAAMPQLCSVCLIGAVDGTDAYEPLGRLRHLYELELSSASQACLDGGLLALSFLPCLASLSVSLDIHPASPCCLNELPTGLHSLQLGSMWLEALPRQITELTGLTSVTLERCQIESNPLPLLLTLPQLASVTVRDASRASSSSSDACHLVPMNQLQQQLAQLLAAEAEAAAAADGHGRRRRHHHHHHHDAAAADGSGSSAAAAGGWHGSARRGLGGLAAGLGGAGARLRGLRDAGSSGAAAVGLSGLGGSDGFANTSIVSLSLIDVGLQQLPSCVSQLVALQDLNLALNYEMGLNAATCLPEELTCLSALMGLCLGHCGLNQLPLVVPSLTGLTRLELQGNALSVPGFGAQVLDVGFKHSLRVLDLGGQGCNRGRLRGIPAWVGSCCYLRELRLGCHCLGYNGGGGSSNRSEGIGNGTTPARSPVAVSAAVGASSGSNAAAVNGGGGGGSPGGSSHYSYTFTHNPGAAAAAAAAGNGGSSSSLARTSGGLANLGGGAAAGGNGGSSSSLARASGGLASAGSSGAATEGLSLLQLPQLLPQLEVLCIEGGVWEHRAVADAIALVRQLERQGSKLQVVLPL